MQLHYNSITNELFIDQSNKTIVINLPAELTEQQNREFIQSQTLYDIIRQLLENK